MRALRTTQANVNGENDELKIILDLGDNNADNSVNPPPSPEPQVRAEDGGSNEDLEKEVTGLKASVELVRKEMKVYKEQYESEKAGKDWAEKSNNLLKAELKKVRENLALRTTEIEAAKKLAEDLRAEKEQA
ncbi:GRIP domain-containing protein [Sesbania bispinosa]|nr:GRIP domain-containing protein [Sesbania bispinosa]